MSYANSDAGVNINLTTNQNSGGYAEGDTLSGFEYIEGSAHNDTIVGRDAAETILGGAGDDYINGGGGNDLIYGGVGADTIDGGDGIDTVSYADASSALLLDLSGGASQGAEAEGDVLHNIEVIVGSNYNDTIIAGNSDATINGGNGDDLIYSGAGADNLVGGAGKDTIDYSNSDAGVNVNLKSGSVNTGGYAEGDALSGFEVIVGSAYNDTLTGSTYKETLIGGDGDDILDGGGGGDYIDGGDGFDLVSYASATTAVIINNITGAVTGAGAGDTLASIEGYIGSANNDQFIASERAEYFDGGDGSDQVNYSNSNAGVTLDFNTGQGSGGYAEGDTILNVERVTGSSHGDHFIMSDNNANMTITYGAGVDTVDYSQVGQGATIAHNAEVIIGSAYNDYIGGYQSTNIYAGDGNDTIVGKAAATYIDGGDGLDIVNYAGSTAAMNINLATGMLSGGLTAGDTLASIEGIIAGTGNDTITGNAQDNYLDGGNGNNRLYGGDGNDTLLGGTGYDSLDGGDGFDIVSYEKSNAAVNVNLGTRVVSGGHANRDTIVSIEGIIGGRYNDTLTAGNTGSYLNGGAGADFITGGDGNDTLMGGDGNDSIIGGAGADVLIGGNGIDTLSYATSNAGVNVNLVTGQGSGGHAQGDELDGFEYIIGSNYNDTIIGTEADETIIGGAGADYLDGGDGIDQMSYVTSTAGVNVDLSTGQASGGHAEGDTVLNFEYLIASNYNDTIRGSAGNDTINAGSGNDYVYASGGADSLIGGNGLDTIDYSQSDAAIEVNLGALHGSGGLAEGDYLSGFEAVIGTAYNDTLKGAATADTLIGGEGDDYLEGLAGNDSLVGGAGNDTLIGGAGKDTLDGGAGFDIASYAGESAIGINMVTGVNTGAAAGEVLTSIEGIIAGNYNDTLLGDAADNYFDGGAGNDSMEGGAGADTLIGGAGIDTLSYASSDAGVNVNLVTGQASGGHAEGDVINGFEVVIGSNYNDTILGTEANETIIGGAGADYMDAGAGVDHITYAASNAGINVNLATGEAGGGHAEGDTVLNFEHIIASNYNDTITGSESNDTIDAGNGNDHVIGSGGSDYMSGGAGLDTIDYSQSESAVNVNLATQRGYEGLAEGDTLSGFEAVIGSAYNDTLKGSSTADTLIGGAGDDYLEGLVGNDSLVGGAGNDTLIGGAGYDTLDGGDGFDIASYASETAIGINLATGVKSGAALGDVHISIEGFIGTSYGDVLIGDAGDNYFDGGGGNDSIEGGAGADTLIGGAGIDTLSYATSDAGVNVNMNTGQASGGHAEGDVVSGFEYIIGSNYDDTLIGSEANETIIGGAGADYMDAGAGIDHITYAASNAGVNVNLATGQASGGHAEGDTVLNFEHIIATSYADTITGSNANDTIDAGAGNDYIVGSLGTDSIVGGAGNDTIDYSQSDSGIIVNLGSQRGTAGMAQGDTLVGFEAVIGSAYDDSIIGSSAAETLSGGDGNDYLEGQYGSDVLIGGAGNDTLNGGNNADTLDGGEGFDIATYVGSTAAVIINMATNVNNGAAQGDVFISIEGVIGTNYTDTIIGDAADNLIDGGSGNDYIEGGAGADTLIGGAGADTLSYASSDAGVNIDLAAGAFFGGHAEGDVISGFETFIGSGHNDTIIGSAANETIIGGAGADYLDGGAGVDQMSYAASDAAVNINLSTGQFSGGHAEGDILLNFEHIIASNYNDTITGSDANDTIDGGAGDDYFYGSAGSDSIIGGAGKDTMDYSASEEAVYINVASNAGYYGLAQGDRYSSIEVFIGSSYDDTLAGGSGYDSLYGGAGNDSLSGGAGDDLLDGGDGDDVLSGGDASDTLYGGNGNDTLIGGISGDQLYGGDGFDIASYETAAGAITVDLSTGRGTKGEAKGDRLYSIEGVIGSKYNDFITGDSGDNYLLGMAGNDALVGGAGNDTLDGGLGHDSLNGGDGDDLLIAGGGTDTMAGGAGADAFAFRASQLGNTTINDFSATDGDIIMIETASGTGSVGVSDGPALTPQTGCFADNNVLIVRDGTHSYVYVDSNGDGNYNSSDLMINVNNSSIDESKIVFTNKLFG